MIASPFDHQYFDAPSRVSQSLCNDRCQNILFKAGFEHFRELRHIAALLLSSKSFQNSSFGANFLVNFVVAEDSIRLIESVLSPSSCFSLQFVPSLYIRPPLNYSYFDKPANDSQKFNRGFINFVGELANTKYLHLSLRSLTLHSVTNEVLLFFFGSSSNEAWPQLQDLTLKSCRLNESLLTLISNKAIHLRNVNFVKNFGVTDAGLESVTKLSRIASLSLEGGGKITDVALDHVGKLSSITSLNLSGCNRITDASLQRVSELTSITFLDLTRCNLITDVGIEHLVTLSSITSLNLSNCNQITDDAKQKFNAALPRCIISF